MTSNVLGIDIGTSSVKVCVMDANAKVVQEESAYHDAWIENQPSECREQDVRKIFSTVICLLDSVQALTLSVHSVSVTGQMHGIVLWNGTMLAQGQLQCSSLFTWMDARVPQHFISSLPPWEEGTVHNGYGIVTVAWLRKVGLLDTNWDCCGTVMDMLICYMGRIASSSIGVQNAFSWGYCNYHMEWTIDKELVPRELLPRIVPSDTVVGTVCNDQLFLPLGVRLFASLGDLQATVYPLLTANSAVLNVGTSAQLCFRCPEDRKFSAPLLTEPFFDHQQLVTAASMNGGNTITLLAQKVLEWAGSLCCADNVSLQLDSSKLSALLKTTSTSNGCSLSVRPTFYEERCEHLPSEVIGLQADTTITQMLQATACGVVSNLCRLLPGNVLDSNGVTDIVLAGNARTPPYSHFVDQFFPGFNIIHSHPQSTCAAYGAALFALRTTQAQQLLIR